MSDYSTELPVRSQLPGQTNYDDILVKIADGTAGATQLLGIDTSGRVTVKLDDGSGNPTLAQAISGSNWLQVVMPATGPAAPGTAATYADLVAGIYNATPPTLTTGQQSALQLDSAGRLLVDAAVVFPYDENWGVVGATTLRTAAEIGNATGAADFNFGTVGAQTLRVASQVGNATGAADFGAGATGAQTLRVTANQGAPNTVANAWPTEITNGTNTASVNASGQLSTTNTSLGSPTGGTAGTQSSLAGGIYNATSPTLTNGQQAGLQLDAAGRLLVDAAVVFPYDENWGTVGATTLRTAAEIGNATGAADFNYGTVGVQTLRVAAQLGNATGAIDYGNGATDAQTVRVAANLAVAGADVTSANPVPVSIVSTTAGTAIQSYFTHANLAAGASTTFTYTVVAAHTFNLERVWSTASGKIKTLVQNNGATIFVGFNSTANPNIDMTVVVPPLIAAGNTVTVTITNTDLVPFDVYATVEGNQN
jgi:hypothetical protein